MSGHFHRNKNILYENANIYEHITASASGLYGQERLIIVVHQMDMRFIK